MTLLTRWKGFAIALCETLFRTNVADRTPSTNAFGRGHIHEPQDLLKIGDFLQGRTQTQSIDQSIEFEEELIDRIIGIQTLIFWQGLIIPVVRTDEERVLFYRPLLKVDRFALNL